MNENLDATEKLKASLAGSTDLFKAEKAGDGDGDKDKYDADYMKKHLKSFMKEEKSYMKECLKSWEDGEEVRKSIIADYESLRTNVDIAGADSVMIDGTDILKKSLDFNNKMARVIEEQNAVITGLNIGLGKVFDLFKASAAATIEGNELIKSISTNVQPIKSVQELAQVQDTQSATSTTLQKAQAVGRPVLMNKLKKAAAAGNSEALTFVTMLDQAGHNPNFVGIRPETLQRIVDLVATVE